MTIAHLGSRLAIKSCLPVDFKNTVFLAHYDITEEENLKGIRPVGNRYTLSFDGVDDYVKVNHSSSIHVTGTALSIECSVYFTQYPSQQVTAFINKESLYEVGLTPGGNLCIALNTNSSSINWDWTVSSYIIPKNKWVHLAITFDGSNIRFYADGVLVDTKAFSGSLSAPIINPLRFAARDVNLDGNTDNFLNVKLSNIRIWNKVLSDEEINKYYSFNYLNGNEIGLVGYWKLNEGSGSIALDYSSNRNHGKIYGATWSDGRIVVTLRPSEGKYGGCIAVEDATTNLVKNGDFSQGGTNWKQPYTGTVIDTDVSMPMFTKAVRMERYDSQHNMWYQDITGQPQQATYTLSQYIKLENYTSGVIGALIYFYYTDGTYTSSLTEVDYTKIGVWQYVTTTGTPNQAKTLNYIRVYAPWSNNLNGSFLCTGVQLEQKPYATSFVNGSRDKGILQYPLIIDPNNFTLNFWAKCTDGGVGPFYVDILVTSDENNRVFFRPTNTTTINGGRVVNGTTSFIGELNLINDITQWNMYTLVSEGSTMRIYQNGVKLGENQSILQLNGGSSYLVFNRDNKPRNALFDEVRIDRVPRTDTEIMEWYMSQAPFYPKGIHKELL